MPSHVAERAWPWAVTNEVLLARPMLFAASAHWWSVVDPLLFDLLLHFQPCVSLLLSDDRDASL